MLSLLSKLYKVNLVSPKGMYVLVRAFSKHGVNLMAMLQFSAKLHPDRIALKDENHEYSYLELYKRSYKLAAIFENMAPVNKTKNVAFLCKNHSVGIQALFAFSRLGANVIFLNIEMSQDQLARIVEQKNFDLILFDNDLIHKVEKINCKCIPCFRGISGSIEEMISTPIEKIQRLKKRKAGNISVLTGGTSGHVKFAKRKTSVMSIARPFFALLTKVELDKYRIVYIPVPMYHGYGLTSLILSIILSAEIITRQKFDTQESLKLIKENQVDIAIVVPTMLKRMIDTDKESLKNLRVILSGGAPLDERLTARVLDELGEVLYNLYGTSEAGFCVLAEPSDLRKYPNSIGKIIKGVSVQILNPDLVRIKPDNIGTLYLKTSWSMSGMKKKYISTGDMGLINREGFIFLKGRDDDMIISGGENVYPKDLEEKLLENPSVDSVAVIGMEDDDFGKRLNAFVVPTVDSKELNGVELKKWLNSRIARYQMPHEIVIVESIPMTITGKLDRKELIKMAFEKS